MDAPFKKNEAYRLGKFEPRAYIPELLAPACRRSGGFFTAILDWLHHADHAMAPIRRSSGGFITPITDWLHNADP
jgi:hypothetical protein